MSTNGRQPFVALRPCGHVLRERVVSEAVSEASGRGGEQGEGGGSIKKSCPVCNAAVSATVRMLPPAEAAEALRVELRRAREQQRKAPKRKLTPQGATGLDPRNVAGALSSQPHLPRPAPPPPPPQPSSQPSSQPDLAAKPVGVSIKRELHESGESAAETHVDTFGTCKDEQTSL